MSIKEKILKKVEKIAILLLLAVIVTSCQQYKNIQVSELSIDEFKFENTTSAKISASVLVNNPTRSTISLADGNAVIKKEGKDFVALTIPTPAFIAPETKERVSIAIDADVLDPIGILTTGLNIASWDLKVFTLDGKITLKSSSGMKKVFKFKDEPIENVFKILKSAL